MFCWIVVGSLLAGMFLSAGPAFYGDVTGNHARFGGLLAFLAQSSLEASAYAVQRYFGILYQNNVPEIGCGISVFASVHVALVAIERL